MNNLTQRDLKNIWHPCSQMKDYELLKPLEIESAEGSYIYTKDGRKMIDAISSWWCKSLGHRHPEVIQAVKKQMDQYGHIIFANTANDTVTELAEKLVNIAEGLDKVFFVDSGSDAVEVAIKMSLQYHQQTDNPQKKNIISLENGYHGETILTLALGDCDLYSSQFGSLMPDILKLKNIPYITGQTDSQWETIGNQWEAIELQLNQNKEDLAAIIVEPLAQGAGGMLIYSPDLLKKMRRWCTENNVHFIADEIMTGFGRTGYYMACSHANIIPDFAVFSKGLTAGFCPFAVVLTSDTIYDAFYDDYETGKAFMHSNTYCGNPIAAAAALAAINVYEQENIFQNVRNRSESLLNRLKSVGEQTGKLTNYRNLGFIAAADLTDESGIPLNSSIRGGFAVYQEALKLGAILRPLGNTLYFFPPLNIEDSTLDDLKDIAVKAIQNAFQK